MLKFDIGNRDLVAEQQAIIPFALVIIRLYRRLEPLSSR